jgi:hypothetical protein
VTIRDSVKSHRQHAEPAARLRFLQADSADAPIRARESTSLRVAHSLQCNGCPSKENSMALKAIVATLILGTSSLVLAGPYQREARDEHRAKGDRVELRHDRNELRRDERHGASSREIRHDRRELREDRWDLGRDRRFEARDRRVERRVDRERGRESWRR